MGDIFGKKNGANLVAKTSFTKRSTAGASMMTTGDIKKLVRPLTKTITVKQKFAGKTIEVSRKVANVDEVGGNKKKAAGLDNLLEVRKFREREERKRETVRRNRGAKRRAEEIDDCSKHSLRSQYCALWWLAVRTKTRSEATLSMPPPPLLAGRSTCCFNLLTNSLHQQNTDADRPHKSLDNCKDKLRLGHLQDCNGGGGRTGAEQPERVPYEEGFFESMRCEGVREREGGEGRGEGEEGVMKLSVEVNDTIRRK